jgi:pyruvate/2-oxoglutarate/acetoin dehydrogenase E1 component
MVNTFTLMRSFQPEKKMGSFTIVPIVCDQGYQGPQSSVNNPGELASLANINVFCLNAAADATAVISDQLVAPGFRVICTSQRAFGLPALETPVLARTDDNAIFKYRSGGDVTIVSYTFSLRDSLALADGLAGEGIQSDVFHVNYVPGMNTSMLLESCARTGSLVLVDDSKSITKFGDVLVTELHTNGMMTPVLPLGRRGCTTQEYGVAEDRFIPDFDAVLAHVRSRQVAPR